MEIVLVLILVASLIAIAAVWIFFWVLAKLVKLALWGLGLPLRAAMTTKPAKRVRTFSDVSSIPFERSCANPDCRAGLPMEARFCGRCGSAVTTGAILHEPLPDATYVVEKRRKKGRKGKWRVVASVSTRPTVLPPRRCRVSRVA